MSRRRSSPADSLEMLLDTMCNTFGGIILIALLVTLLARDLKQSTSAIASPIEETRLAESLSHAIAAQEELAKRLADPRHTNIVMLVQHREALVRQTEALREQVSLAEQKGNPSVVRSNTQARIHELNRQNDELLLQLSAAARDSQSAVTQVRDLERQKEGQVRQMRLPREQSDRREQWFVAMRHGRVYPLYRYQPHQFPTRVRNTTMLDWEERDRHDTVKPKPNRGIDLKTDPATFQTLMRQLPRNQFYVVFLTYGDSYAAFTEAKRIVLELGLGHGLELIPERAAIELGPDGERVRRQ